MRRFFCALFCLTLIVTSLQYIESGNSAGASAEKAPLIAPAGKWILIEIHQKRLTLYEGTHALQTFVVATGAYDTPTPLGVYRINSRFSSEMSGFGTRFLGLNVPWGQYGIHGTNRPGSIGQNASHGCVRMRVKDAETLYKSVPNGTKVVIEGGPYGLLDTSLRILSPGDRNGHVYLAQRRLFQQGFYFGTCDGIYGQGMSRAVLAARKAHGLPAVDRVDAALYQKLGLMLFE